MSDPRRYPPEFNQAQEAYLLSNLVDWALAHGLVVKPPLSLISQDQDALSVLATPAPVTLFPSLLPRSCFEYALEIQKHYSELYSAIARDEIWLKGIVEEWVSTFYYRFCFQSRTR
jgi:glutathione synthase